MQMPAKKSLPVLVVALSCFCSCFYVSGVCGGNSGEGSDPPVLGGVWAFQWENMGGTCGAGGGYEVVAAKFLQNGWDLSILLDVDGNSAFDDGVSLDGSISKNGDQVLVTGSYEYGGESITLNGSLEFMTFGYMTGMLTREIDGTCSEDLGCSVLWTSNAPTYDLSGVWNMVSTIAWVDGSCSLSAGSSVTEEWVIESIDSGLTPGLIKITVDGGVEFIGVMNSSQLTFGRRYELGFETIIWQYTSMNVDEWGGSNGTGAMFGTVLGIVEAGDMCTFGMDLSSSRS